ncbi:hypothetical protein ACVWV0_001899 [Ewingella americana]
MDTFFYELDDMEIRRKCDHKHGRWAWIFKLVLPERSPSNGDITVGN